MCLLRHTCTRCTRRLKQLAISVEQVHERNRRHCNLRRLYAGRRSLASRPSISFCTPPIFCVLHLLAWPASTLPGNPGIVEVPIQNQGGGCTRVGDLYLFASFFVLFVSNSHSVSEERAGPVEGSNNLCLDCIPWRTIRVLLFNFYLSFGYLF